MITRAIARHTSRTEARVHIAWEALNLWCMSGWSFSLFLYPHLFSSNPLFQPMGAVAPEWAWGMACLIISVGMLLAIITRNWDAIYLSHTAALGVWALLGIGFWVATPWISGFWIYSGLAAGTVYRLRKMG